MTAAGRVEEFVRILDMTPTAPDRFTASNIQTVYPHLYGGQAIAQALHAAALTAGDRPVNSLHAYFLRAGAGDQPVHFEVEREFEGRSVCNRRVVMTQQEREVLKLSASFHVGGSGFEHQQAAPDFPGPEELPDEIDVLDSLDHPINPTTFHSMRARPYEVRVSPELRTREFHPAEAPQYQWFRACSALPDDMRLHSALIAYVSDYSLMNTSMLIHGMAYFRANGAAASMDHAMWFHHQARADEWLLFVIDSPWAAQRRSLARGSIYTREGRLVATVVQEGILRRTG